MIQKKIILILFFLNHLIVSAQIKSKLICGNDGYISTTEIKGDTLYFGGSFSRIYTPTNSGKNGSQIDLSSGNLSANLPKPNGMIKTIVSDSAGGWYIGGYFSKVGDSIRNNIAHINSAGLVSTQFKDAKGFSGIVESLNFSNNKLYVGGNFKDYGFLKLNGAVINKNDSNFSRNFPDPDGEVLTAVSDGLGGWFIGGSFTMIGDSLRNNIAQIDSNGTVTSFNPNANNTVKKIVKNGSNLFVSGSFNMIGGQLKFFLASINILNGQANIFDGKLGGLVDDFIINSNTIFIGGQFTQVSLTNRNYLAALDLNTGSLLSWNPNANNKVNAMNL
jgi:hypothetical protein